MKQKILIAILVTLSIMVFAQSVNQIVSNVDKEKQFDTLIYKGSMTIKLNNETRVKEMVAWISEDEKDSKNRKAYVEFTNPEDKGVKYLKLDDQLWIYYPEAEESIKISGHMLKDGMMGSDVSYEDTLENRRLVNMYNASLIGEDFVNGANCYKIELKAKVKNPTYFHRIIWVSKDNNIIMKDNMFSRGGKRLLKVIDVLRVEKIDGRYYATKIKVSNKLRGNSHTIFEMSELKFDEELPQRIFQLRNLESKIYFADKFF